MSRLYRKNRPAYWYIQYVDSDKEKHDKSTGLRADNPNDTEISRWSTVRLGKPAAASGRQLIRFLNPCWEEW